MPRFFRHSSVALLAVLTGVVAGCSSPKAEFEKEDFAQNDTYSRTVPAASAAACDAGRRALLSQGYYIDRFESARVSGHKNFQGEDGQHTQISFNIECAADSGSNERATVFANAVQDRYSIKRTASSASVGVSVLGQVSMPFGSSDDSLVKTASQTVSRPKFYEGFFQLLQRFLPDAQAATAPQPSPSSHRAKAAPKPADPVVSPDAPADTLNPAAASDTPAETAKKAPAAGSEAATAAAPTPATSATPAAAPAVPAGSPPAAASSTPAKQESAPPKPDASTSTPATAPTAPATAPTAPATAP